MKYLTILISAICLLSCGPSHLNNEDIQVKLLSKSGALHLIYQGDSWEDVKKLAGDYWAVREDESLNLYQLRRELKLGSEMMFVGVKLDSDVVGGISVYILSESLSASALKLYALDIMDSYKAKFGIDFEQNSKGSDDFNGKRYNYQYSEDTDGEGASSITVLCFAG